MRASLVRKGFDEPETQGMDREADGPHLQGGYRQGGKLLPERELAALLATSRPLLREALISLEALGYLDIRNRQGIYMTGDVSSEALGALGRAQVWPMEILSQVMEGRGRHPGSISGIPSKRWSS